MVCVAATWPVARGWRPSIQICTLFIGILQHLDTIWRKHPQEVSRCITVQTLLGSVTAVMFFLLTASLGLGGLASTGCQTLSTAQSGMQTGVSTAQTTKSTADQTKQLGTDLKGEVDKATGKNRRGRRCRWG